MNIQRSVPGYQGVSSTTSSLPIAPLHTSFRDYLTTRQRSGVFYIDVAHSHATLTHSCLGVMLQLLKFNICGIESSHYRNIDVPDLPLRIVQFIPTELSYACRSWGDHLSGTAFSAELLDLVKSLLTDKFLFWLEVLGTTGNADLAPTLIRVLSVSKVMVRCSPCNSYMRH